MSELCKHEEIVDEGGLNICIDCGEEIGTITKKEWFFEQHQIRSVHVVTIQKDVAQMNIIGSIIDVADVYFRALSKARGPFKNVSRKGIIFACVYFAGMKLGKPFNAKQLRNTFGLTKKRALRGLKSVQMNIPKNIKLEKTVITPEDIVEQVMKEFDASSDQIEHVKRLASKLISMKSDILNKARTHSVIKSLVYYYITDNGIDISLRKFSKKVRLTEKTILDNTKEIVKVLGVLNEA